MADGVRFDTAALLAEIADLRKTVDRLTGPAPRTATLPHGLQIIQGSDIARVAIPGVSANNAPKLDPAAGHVIALGTPPNEQIILTMGAVISGGAWAYEAGVSVARAIVLLPDGSVEFLFSQGGAVPSWQTQMVFSPEGFFISPQGYSTWQTLSALLFKGSNQGIPSGAFTTVTFDQVVRDPYSLWQSGSQQFQAPRTGWYFLSTSIAWDTNANGVRTVTAEINGGADIWALASNLPHTGSGGSFGLVQNSQAPLYLTAGYLVGVSVQQTAGATVNVVGSPVRFPYTYAAFTYLGDG